MPRDPLRRRVRCARARAPCAPADGCGGRSSGDPDSFQPYDEVDRDNAIYSVSREQLNNQLLDAAEKLPNVELKFGCR